MEELRHHNENNFPKEIWRQEEFYPFHIPPKTIKQGSVKDPDDSPMWQAKYI